MISAPLDKALSWFFADVHRPMHINLSDRSALEVERSLRYLDQWHGKLVSMAELSDALVASFMAARRKLGDSPATVNNRRAHILSVWRFARDQRYVRTRPRRVPKIKEPIRIPRAWTVEQVESLLSHSRRLQGDFSNGVPKRLFWPAMELAVYWTGCRPKALMAARPCDFDAGRASLIIRAETEKTGRDRYYALHQQCVEAISSIWDPCRDRLLPWPHCPRYLWTCFRRIVEASGLPSTKDGRDLFYRLRRTNLSYCAAADERIAQAQGGHAAFVTTRRYLDPSIARSRSAADVLPVPRIESSTRQLTLPGF
jgi:integrase